MYMAFASLRKSVSSSRCHTQAPPYSLLIIHFKTDDIGPDEIAARLESYRPQGAAYAWALDRLGISPVIRVVFYFVRPGVEMSLEAGPALLAEGEKLIMSAVLPSPA